MQPINIFIACIMVVTMYKLIAKKSIHLNSGMVIDPCRVCCASGYVTGAFCETHVRCSNTACSMTGPNAKNATAAITAWNNIPSMQSIIAWQFQAAGAALALQRLMIAGQAMREEQTAYEQYGSNEDSVTEAEAIFDGLIDDVLRKIGGHDA